MHFNINSPLYACVLPSQYKIKNKRTDTFLPDTQILASATSSNRPPSPTTLCLVFAYLSEKDKREMCANPKRSKLILLFSPSVINVAPRTALHASSSSILLFIFHR